MNRTSFFGSMLTVVRKEWLDFYRDRRTFMLSLLVAPLLYPLIFLGIGKLSEMRAETQLEKDLALPVEDLNLTVRSYNCLKREGIHTVGELISRSEQDLLDIRNFGAKSIDEVKAKLVEMGLSLKDSAPGFDPATALAAYDDDDDSFVEDEQY